MEFKKSMYEWGNKSKLDFRETLRNFSSGMLPHAVSVSYLTASGCVGKLRDSSQIICSVATTHSTTLSLTDFRIH